MDKIVRIGTSKTHGGRGYSIYCHIRFKDGRLSISGVEGPLSSGNALGSWGQIDMHDWHISAYAPGWNKALEIKFRKVWKRWHLNDLKTVIPQGVVEFLDKLPETDKSPAWG